MITELNKSPEWAGRAIGKKKRFSENVYVIIRLL
jgi:hypothetical protein